MHNFKPMTNSEAFTAAHEMTRATILPGDDYRATFALCLKVVFSASYRMIEALLQGLHCALDDGDVPLAGECIESLALYPEQWTADHEESYQWLAAVYHDSITDEAA